MKSTSHSCTEVGGVDSVAAGDECFNEGHTIPKSAHRLFFTIPTSWSIKSFKGTQA